MNILFLGFFAMFITWRCLKISLLLSFVLSVFNVFLFAMSYLIINAFLNLIIGYVDVSSFVLSIISLFVLIYIVLFFEAKFFAKSEEIIMWVNYLFAVYIIFI